MFHCSLDRPTVQFSQRSAYLKIQFEILTKIPQLLALYVCY